MVRVRLLHSLIESIMKRNNLFIHSDINRSKEPHPRPGFHRDKLQREYRKNLDSPHQVRGRLSQARNDNLQGMSFCIRQPYF